MNANLKNQSEHPGEKQRRHSDGRPSPDELNGQGVEEISEDAYKQNDVYQSWKRPPSAGGKFEY